MRIRTIKPIIFRSSTVTQWHSDVRWTFAGLFCYCDDEGRGRDDPSLIKADIWPRDRRVYGLDNPVRTIVGNGNHNGLLFSGWYKSNGSHGNETAPHPALDPFNTFTSHDTTTLLTAQWREHLADLRLEDCYFRMMFSHEIGRGCGFDVDFRDYRGSFRVWGSARNQVDGFGNAVSPPVGYWIGGRLRAALHGEQVAA